MIRDSASQNQVIAADPNASTWVAANAGSGKTRVLTDRVARLLLQEVDPQNILCLTYTKAAAIEMQNRLFKRLGAWSMMDAAELRSDLTGLGFEGYLDDEAISKARTLFAEAIETPGGLKIQTIHSFCSSILRRFPLEAGVSPQFREMEDQTARLLRSEVLDAMSVGDDASVTKAMLAEFTGADLDKFLSEVTSRKAKFNHLPSDQDLAALFRIDPGVSSANLIASLFGIAECDLIKRLKTALAMGTSSDQKALEKLDRLNLSNPTFDDIAILESVFLFGEKAKSSYGAKVGSFPTKKLREANSELVEDLDTYMEQVEGLRETRLSIAAFERTKTLYDFAVPFVASYEARKLSTSQLDFDDLIGKTKDLLGNQKVAQWVLFRLDGGIDHVLVDEAQDTSPDQWDVVEALTREFSSGEGARPDAERTIFVVGDKQQSIYSFQGADPNAFDRMQKHFQTSLENVGKPLMDVKLSHSFRSSAAILRTVDDTFTDEKVDAIGKVQNHIAFNDTMPGRVDLWPVIEQVKQEDETDWTDPVDLVSETHHNAQLADQIADQIAWMIRNESLPVKRKGSDVYDHRSVTPGDVMILVQRRSELFHEIIAACKRKKLPIAGADRLRIGGELAVKDLTALLNFIALPEDDLSLACALRSPLFGWGEQDLYTLAHKRTTKFLWPALRDGDYPATLSILKDLRDQADFLRPYDMLERILTRHSGRKKLLGRLGQEAEDGIDALLSQALLYESTEIPSLTGFLNWMQADDLEIKRQMDSQEDQIRVMTVHGSKGLEAPIVFLPDCATRKNDVRADLLPSDDHIIWKPLADKSPEVVREAKAGILQKQSEERLRLLYVAMTRAENWLIVAAAGKVDDETWYTAVENGMDRSGAVEAQSGNITVKRVFHGDWGSGEDVEATTKDKSSLEPLELKPVDTPSRKRLVSPSDLGGAKALPGEVAEDDNHLSKTRGTAIHSLLEVLPDLPEDLRLERASQILRSYPERDHFEPDLAEKICAILTNNDLNFVFAKDTLSEVAITADVPNLGGRLYGIIDRLIVAYDKVTAIDFKSNRLVPSNDQDTPEGILRQMGAYAEALGETYPGKSIQTAILWTETGALQYLPDQLVSDALNRVKLP